MNPHHSNVSELQRSRMRRSLVKSLRAAGVRGRIVATAEGVSPYGRDFGGVFELPPLVVVSARDEADVVRTFRSAIGARVPLAVRSAGHSCGGQTLAPDGIVLEHYRAGARLRMLSGNRVEIDTSSRWYDVERTLNRLGRSVPVLPDYLHLSVGGTLAVGGFGHRSIRQGCQVDHVEGFRVVRQNGEAVYCTPAAEPALAVEGLASLGRLGVMTRVVMQTLPRPVRVEAAAREPSSFSELRDVLVRLVAEPAERPDYFCASITGRRIVTRVGRDRFDAGASPARPSDGWEMQTHRHRETWLGRFPDHRRVWADYVFESEGAGLFLEWLDATRRGGGLPNTLTAVYVLALHRPGERPPFSFDPAPPGMESLVFSVGLYHMVAPGDAEGLRSAHGFVRSALRRALALGGRPYLYGWNPLDATEKARLAKDSDARLTVMGRGKPSVPRRASWHATHPGVVDHG